MHANRRLLGALSIFVILTTILSSVHLPVASAQGNGGIQRDYNAESGKVTRITGTGNEPITLMGAMSSNMTALERSNVLVERFAPEFGLIEPSEELVVAEESQPESNRVVTKYQQVYEGVPVMGGELIVNASNRGALYSMNGEVAQGLSLDTEPAISVETAIDIARQGMVKWYGGSKEDYQHSDASLQIFDESLLRPSPRSAELVWKMEMTPVNLGEPIRELVLVGAKTGNIPLHFNQIDTAWHNTTAKPNVEAQDEVPPTETPTPEPVEPPIQTESPDIVSSDGDVEALAGSTWYVATTGNDSNTCDSAGSPCATINGAIAKAAASGDTIKVTTGTYTGSGNEVVNVSKSVAISGGWDLAFGSQTGRSTIDGENLRRGILTNADAVLDRFLIKNGKGIGNFPGGGIYSDGVTGLKVNNSIVQNSSAWTGGGIYKGFGSLTLNNTSISNNTGGGIVGYESTLTINNTTINNNSNAAGGGIQIWGNLTLNNSTISNNRSDDGGGGIYVQDGTVVLKNSILGNNFSITGPDCVGPITSAGNNIISNKSGCTVTARNGDRFNTDPKLGIFLPALGYQPLLPGSPAINKGNSATCRPTDQRGLPRVGTCDIGAYEYTSPGVVVALAVTGGDGQHIAPGFPAAKPLEVAALDSQGAPVSGVEVTFDAPMSGPGGSFTSADLISISTITDERGVATGSDFTANDQFGSYDISASAIGVPAVSLNLENAGWYVSTTGSDSNSCSNSGSPCQTINGAIDKAADEDTIVVATGVYTGTGNIVVTIEKSLQLSGGWNNGFSIRNAASIIDGENLRHGVLASAGASVNILMENFAIINGDGSYAEGGSVINNGSTLTLINTTVSNGSALYGGGIHNRGVLILNNTTVSGNNAAFGGGIYNYDGLISLRNSLIGNNHTTNLGPDCYGFINASEFSLIGDTTDCEAPSGRFNIFDENPILGAFDAAGGFYPLLLGSPAINAANSVSCPSIDQRGVARPQGTSCDIGAYEYDSFDSDPDDLLLRTYDADNSWDLPGSLVCDQTNPTCSGGDGAAQSVHRFTADMYDFYKDTFGRNSIDDNGLELVSAVHYGAGYQNAFWNSYMMVYGDGYGFANADDVIGHEITHGFTEHESNLFYYYQSGAINESFSDLWGEYFDQTNGEGSDGDSYDWLIGEDVTGRGASRSMKNPPQFGDPDKMTSPLYNEKPYYNNAWDNGGVHSNSGVNNKAVYLMVAGGTFNGKTISALGWEKVGAIYYEVNTNLLTSGSDYSDLYYALQQACTNLDGEHGITSVDCIEVKDAVDAVQMNHQPTASFNPDAPLCPTGMTTSPSITLFKDGFENSTGNWQASGNWNRDTFNTAGGTYMMWGDDGHASSENTLTLLRGVTVPAGSTPFLHFKHSFLFEHDPSTYYDGAVLEYSTNKGSTWIDAKSLFSAGQNYKGNLDNAAGSSNVLKGRAAFVGDSHGYVSSRYDLSSLAGKTVQFRWRFATDQFFFYWGWFLDDISIYKCVGTPSVPALQLPANNALMKNYAPLLDWSNAKSIDHYELQVATDNGFDSLVYNELNVPASQFQIPSNLDSNTKYYWRVRGVNGIGQPGKWTSPFAFRAVPEPPELVSPIDIFVSKELRPLFDWDAPGGPGVITGYTIQIAKDALFKQVVHTGSPIGSEYVPTANLPKNTTLYWRVLAKGANGSSGYSEIRSIVMPLNPPPTPLLLSPSDNAVVREYNNPTFKWKPVTFADASFQHYQVQVATDAAFLNLVLDNSDVVSRATGQLVTTLTLTPDTRYYWRVRAVNVEDEVSNWSTVWTLRAAIPASTLTLPANGETNVSRKPLLDWEDVPGNNGYVLQVWKGTTLVKSVTLPPGVSQYQFVTNLLANTSYTWKVQTKGNVASSTWSQSTFKTGQ